MSERWQLAAVIACLTAVGTGAGLIPVWVFAIALAFCVVMVLPRRS